jgi:hypothetical protein
MQQIPPQARFRALERQALLQQARESDFQLRKLQKED